MKKTFKILRIDDKKAEIEIPSLRQIFRIPLDIFDKFSKKRVKITIEVKS